MVAFYFSELEATLKRLEAPSLFGSDILELSFVAEMQTENRLRFKVGLLYEYFYWGFLCHQQV